MFLNFIPLRERRPRSVPLLPTLMLFQFTPLRKGQQYLRHPEHDPEHISIHAPTQGATWMNDRDAKKNKFQFTPLRKGRPFPPARRTSPINFNSRPYARGDRRPFCALEDAVHISIHAPTQGATAKDMRFQQIFCSTLTNHRTLTATPYNLQGLS